MTISRVWRVALATCALIAALLPAPARAQTEPMRELAIAFIDRTGDALYQGSPGYAGLYRPEHFSPYPAAELAVKDSAAAARARGFNLSLLRKSLTEAEDATSAVRTLAVAQGVIAAILDLPAEETLQLAKNLGEQSLILFNARHRDDAM